MFYEPLAAWDGDGNLVPILAAEVPTPKNGGVAADGRSVMWKLKRNVQWHDGKPFTADDVVFNWEYAADPATAATTIGSYKDIKVDKIDSHTVRVEFDEAHAVLGRSVRRRERDDHPEAPVRGLQGRQVARGAGEPEARRHRLLHVRRFPPRRPGRGQANPNYHETNRPHFDAIEMKGGGDAVSAARAVLQTGEFDYAWNMQVEDEILKRLEAGGKGQVRSSRRAASR